MADLYKILPDRKICIDFSDIHVPSWKIREVQKAGAAKRRAMRKIDPFYRLGGARKKYETPEELRAACEDYFNSQKTFIYNKHGDRVKNPDTGEYEWMYRPLTLSGLARYLGIATNTLVGYQYVAQAGLVPREYADIVLEARQRIEEYAESRGYDKDGASGSKFVLQAGFGWKTDKEKQEELKLKVDAEVARERLKMQKEKHRLEMKLLEAGINPDEDSNNVQITITRAIKPGDGNGKD